MASVLCLFFAVLSVSLKCVIVAFSGHTHLLIPVIDWETQTV